MKYFILPLLLLWLVPIALSQRMFPKFVLKIYTTRICFSLIVKGEGSSTNQLMHDPYCNRH